MRKNHLMCQKLITDTYFCPVLYWYANVALAYKWDIYQIVEPPQTSGKEDNIAIKTPVVKQKGGS